MNLEFLYKLLAVLQFVALSQNSHVNEAKQRIRAEVRSVLGLGNHHYNHRHPPYQRHHQAQHLPRPHVHYHGGAHWSEGHRHPRQRVQRLEGHHNRWSGRHGPIERHHHFTAWTAWSKCNSDCVKRRERYCKTKRKCGFTKHLEERKCWSCHMSHGGHSSHSPQQQQQQQQQQTIHHSTSSNTPQTIIINAAASGSVPTPAPLPPAIHVHHIHVPVLQEIVDYHPKQQEHQQPEVESTKLNPVSTTPEREATNPDQNYLPEDEEASEGDDFHSLTTRPPKYRKEQKPMIVGEEDYAELISEEYEDLPDDTSELTSEEAPTAPGVSPALLMRSQDRQQRRGRKMEQIRKRNLAPGDDGIEGDTFQYEDFDFDSEAGRGFGMDSQYSSSSYEDNNDYNDFNNSTFLGPTRERATPDNLIPRHRRVYSKWSRWTKCSPKCTTRRYKKCRVREQCGREVLREIAYCYTEGSFCQQWLQAQMQKSPSYEVRPVAASRRRDIDGGTQSNSIVSDFIMNSKGYRGPEYAPMKLKCGIASIRSNKRNMYNMLKIIGGKAARKGEWPWQVAIFNRFKEAFCGGTLVAPQWVLTAAHCVRKVLYVRIGEHNLDYEDGTEMQLRVLKSFKHPNFDKKTVDSDVALLKLPKPVNATSWIGFSCLPRPYQPLPKSVECTVIGWGKRRNRDVAGTSVLHQAEVPIIPMDNCRMVYQDYTITKNMFCAGHKRGRIDTCAGDSGGPLLCRDTTKPNHPWTIFGITSFGDGCAKRNKFGIYAKVPNYVDWVWSVINCNGNCKLHQRN